jgi:hypothetical protein
LHEVAVTGLDPGCSSDTGSTAVPVGCSVQDTAAIRTAARVTATNTAAIHLCTPTWDAVAVACLAAGGTTHAIATGIQSGSSVGNPRTICTGEAVPITDATRVLDGAAVPDTKAILVTRRIVITRVAVADATVIKHGVATVDTIAVTHAGRDPCTSADALATVVGKRGSTWLSIAVTRKLTGLSTDTDVTAVEVRSAPKNAAAVYSARGSARCSANTAVAAVHKRIPALNQRTVTWLNTGCSFDAGSAEVTECCSVGHARAIGAAATIATANVADVNDRTAAPDAITIAVA